MGLRLWAGSHPPRILARGPRQSNGARTPDATAEQLAFATLATGLTAYLLLDAGLAIAVIASATLVALAGRRLRVVRLGGIVDAWAEKDPGKMALLWVNQQGEERHYSFRDMKTGSDRAARLLQDCGISKGDRVFLMLPRIPEWWVLVIALIKLGAVYTPAPTLLTPHDISYRLRIGRFALVITDR